MLGLSQEKLGEAIGVTLQQVHKYEKGENRIGASRLSEIARVLQVPEAFFFEASTVDLCEASSELLELAAALARIRDAKLRWHLINMIEQMAKAQD